ncbi:MAG: DNA replication/repair protein RecF [Bacillaceae bacterium]|nr:DNA replication/repair protein RecF [Bacillaceae bacterium]
MFLNHIELTHFRNYDQLRLSFDRNVTLFVGQNAQGKTNLLEAIFTLAMAKSHRTSKDRELIQWEQDFAVIKGEASRKYSDPRLELQLSGRGKKAKLNGIEQRKLSDYVGALNVVMFAPEDLSIVKGSPSVRRRFLDMEIGQVSPAYLYHLSDYNKLVSQRNQYLKEIYLHKQKTDMLDVWNQQMAQLIVKILKKRWEFIDKINEWADAIHQNITNSSESLTIRYDQSIEMDPNMPENEAIDVILDHFNTIQEKEIMRGTTLAGPHRDDLSFFINQINVQQFGSQGQQRTTALSVKLAELELIHEEVGEYPILLLDDVLSELDESRQSHLLDTIQGRVQTFVTTTGVEGLRHQTLENATVYRVKQGSIQSMNRGDA